MKASKSKVIGLIGFTGESSVVDYYQCIQANTKSEPSDFHYDIIIYSIKKYDDENDVIARLCEVYFYMMRNGAQAILFTNHQLEMLSHFINMPGAPFVLSAATAIVTKVRKGGIKKCLVFDLSLTPQLGFLLNELKSQNIDFVVLNEKDRQDINEMMDLETDIGQLSENTIKHLSNMFGKLSGYGIDAILIDSPITAKIAEQIDARLPIISISEVHVVYAINSLNTI